MMQIQMKDVRTTYNGLNGCACGCGGEYFDAAYHEDTSWRTVNPRGAKMRVNKINKALAAGDPDVTVIDFGDEVMFEIPTGEDRVTRVYVNGA